MAIQGWVEHWLDRYCPPGTHDFSARRPGVLVCQRCKKQALAGHGTCIVCGIPGEYPAVITHGNGEPVRVEGKVCGPCLDDFARERDIRGWRLDTAV